MVIQIRKQPRNASYTYCVVTSNRVYTHHCYTIEEAKAYAAKLVTLGYTLS